MLNFLAENIGSIFVGSIVFTVFLLVLIKLINDFRTNKHPGGCCAACSCRAACSGKREDGNDKIITKN